MTWLKQLFCKHKWKYYSFFIYYPKLKPNKHLSKIKKGWFYEAKWYLESIGGEGLLPFFCSECECCGKQTPAAMDTLIEGTIASYLPTWRN